jgi:hypothetical protein
MPYHEPDQSDPQVLVGVGLPAEAQTMTEMAYVFAEEFCRMGWAAPMILRVFSDPFYAGPHRAYRALGEPALRAIVEECVGVWGGRRGDPTREGA